MANTYSFDILKIVVGQICQTIGWHSICTTPLDVLIDVLHRYILKLAVTAKRYGEQACHTQPNMADIMRAFSDMGINVTELEEYVEYVAPVPCAVSVPKYPVERESHLNLLKPGSREVVTRPVHIHEHLPAMYPELEEEEYLKQLPLSVDITGSEPGTSPLASPKNSLFKRPGDPVSVENNLLKRARMMLEEEGRPLREISSVMMTTSGFLSPAREGKLPEARTPTQSSDSRSSSPQPLSYPTVPPEVKGEKKVKKYNNKPVVEGVRKAIDKEIGKAKDFSIDNQVIEEDDSNVKKLVSMKEMYKLKALKPVKMHSPNNGASSSSGNKIKTNKHRNIPTISPAVASLPKIPKLSQTKNTKSEKPSIGAQVTKAANIDKGKDLSVIDGKLSSEPDKQKLNIFKKISKVKEEKADVVDMGKNTNENPSVSADLENKQRDMRWAQISETIEAVIQKSREQPVNSPEKPDIIDIESSESEIFSYDDDLSPPGTPSTPRTPDLIPPQKKSDKYLEAKKKKKGKRDRDRKESKDRYTHSPSPKRFKSESTESDYSYMEKPKTPEVESSRDEPVLLPRNREDVMSSHVFPFFPFPPAPGLIPPPIVANSPLFNRFTNPLNKQPGGLVISHPAMPNLPLPPPSLVSKHETKHEELLPAKPKKQPSSLSPTPPVTPQQVQSSRSPTPRVSPSSRTSPSSHISSVTVASTITISDSPETPPASVTPIKEKYLEKKKEHKKEKKDKIKKKKDKKGKLKTKEKGEKKKIKNGKKIKDKDKIKEKKDKKEKKKEKEREEKDNKPEAAVPKLTLKLGPPSPQTVTPSSTVPETTHRKIVIKPVIEPPKVDVVKEEKRSPSPELARISALVTRPTNSKPTPPIAIAQTVEPLAELSFPSSPKKLANNSTNQAGLKLKTKEVTKKTIQGDPEKKELVAFYFDKEGNQVWICPACGGQDDGSPMIGCDGCDAWYHWVCVGIQVPPDSNDWFCRVCISKRQDILVGGDKKKKTDRRKKKTGAS